MLACVSGVDAQVVERFASALRRARRVLFITGAGISADSGLPTYRGIGGLYERTTTDEGIPIEMALSGGMLRTRPDLCWKYIHQIEAACRGAAPNRGHDVIARLRSIAPSVDVWVLTQNVDGFHRRAGSDNVIEIHGNIHELHCTRCPYETRVPDYAALAIPPSCPDCGALVRPRVVLFGEQLPARAVEQLSQQLQRGFDLIVSIGTSSAFPYIAAPVLVGNARGAMTIEINPGETEVSDAVALRIKAGAAATLDALWRALDPGGERGHDPLR
jgi:NAD-dependent deacetylase